MNTEYNKNRASQTKTRKSPQQLFKRTPQELKLQYDTRSFQAQLKRAKKRIQGLKHRYFSNRKTKINFSLPFVTPRKNSAPIYKELDNNKHVSLRSKYFPEGVRIEKKVTSKENSWGSNEEIKCSAENCQSRFKKPKTIFLADKYSKCFECMETAEKRSFFKDLKLQTQSEVWRGYEKQRERRRAAQFLREYSH